MSASTKTPLLGGRVVAPAPSTVSVTATVWWRVVHALAFVVGGATFTAGSSLLLLPTTDGNAVGVLYTLGSLSFLTVDVLEFFTFTSPRLLRLNILASALGSTAYVIGSIGFIQPVAMTDAGPAVGNWGFIVGSALIGASQLCKVVRIWRDRDVENRLDRLTAIGVEGGAGIGAACFLIG